MFKCYGGQWISPIHKTRGLTVDSIVSHHTVGKSGQSLINVLFPITRFLGHAGLTLRSRLQCDFYKCNKEDKTKTNKSSYLVSCNFSHFYGFYATREDQTRDRRSSTPDSVKTSLWNESVSCFLHATPERWVTEWKTAFIFSLFGSYVYIKENPDVCC